MVGWAIRGLYRRTEEKTIPPEVKGRLQRCGDLGENELIDLLTDVRRLLGKREDLDNNKDVDISLLTMTDRLDPYTTYIDKQALGEFQRGTNATFTGVGVQVRKDAITEYLLVLTPIKGSPAYKAGLKTGDLITTITREMDSEGNALDRPEVLETQNYTLSAVIEKILGKPGTKVKMTVQREGFDKPLQFNLTRGSVQVETVFGVRRRANDDWDYFIDPVARIGYVRLTQFGSNTFRDLKQAMSELQAAGSLRGLVLDLRFNPGGIMQGSIDISDLFIDDGLIVTVRPRVGRETPYYGESAGSLLNFPMVVLVNGASASASEIVSACLQDHKRAVIIGERSYGKGCLQTLMDFKTGGQFKVTTSLYWRPSGKNLNKASTGGTALEEWGVTPDKGFVVELSRAERDELERVLHDTEIIPRRDLPMREPKEPFKDRQLDKAVEYLRGQIKKAG
jgi:carboxyl-terminal processing protease